jgi:hypothetical protein
MEYGQTAMAFLVHDERFSHERDSLVFKLNICILKTNKQKRKKERKGVKIQGNLKNEFCYRVNCLKFIAKLF